MTGEDPQLDAADDLVPVGTPIDLDNCAREPIHIPGSIQPRGVLAVVREPDLEIRQVSANVAELLGRSVEDRLGPAPVGPGRHRAGRPNQAGDVQLRRFATAQPTRLS